ncbi:ras guanine nucleotide exchange factor domain-containing protein [Thamnocephalis sphaerospora]|uniref:Ras guanine nucleotide exchange factor domain-containing protein n=1 Tax=Thamnocephalis sphaerospora TaxID=78915 RepID=A0A4P9XKQ8_9FUNG|nr:ras guanine nucleotide exchange factor domain-containing protein [Thamnocephalis sphaerospora]|eukprot:RKP06352.1 ras guanine nucleotide exchange factor domain-containing protein [Thamnocephalis sphaerospora]
MLLSDFSANLAQPPGDAVGISSSNSVNSADQGISQTEERPWYLGYDYKSDEVVFTAGANVKGDTLPALVELCTLHDAFDSTFASNFLLTYRSFTTSDELMNLLFERFLVQPPSGLMAEELSIWRQRKQTPIQLRVFNIMEQWLESVYQEADDADVLVKLREFVASIMSAHLDSTLLLLKLIEKREKELTDATLRKLVRNIKQEAPPSILPKNLHSVEFLDIDALEFARQLTIMDSQLYCKIMPVEWLSKAWSNKENSRSVNIKMMIEISNHLTHWVIELILQEKDARKRGHLIRHFVSIAEKCMNLNNYNSLMAILAGLNSAPIHRLKRTWELVPARTNSTLEVLKNRMNPTRNFSTYREGLHSIDPPCVPFLGVYLTDLTFIDDGNPDKLPKTDLINFSKYSKCADVISEIQQYQSFCSDLYNMSLYIEPREREDEKIGLLLHESGSL